jgi:hypothetical protein
LVLVVPPGALDHDVPITITPTSPPAAGSIGQVYEIGPTGTQFAQPASLRFAYTDAELAGQAPSDVAVSTIANGAWVAVADPSVDPSAHTITGTTSHLSPYALVAMANRLIEGGSDDGGASTSPEGGSDGASASSEGGSDSDAAACAMCSGTCVDVQTDNANCGSCGNACATTGPAPESCVLGACVATLMTLGQSTNLMDVLVTGGNVYSIDNLSCDVYSVPAAGGGATKLNVIPDGGYSVGCPVEVFDNLVTDGTSLYWIGGGGVAAMPLGGGVATIVAQSSTVVDGFTVVPPAIYATNLDGLSRWDAPQSPSLLVPAGGNIPGWLLHDASNLYFFEAVTTGATTTAYSVPIGGTSPTMLASSPANAALATLGSDAVYVVAGHYATPYAVGKVPFSGGGVQLLYPAAGSVEITAIAVDSTTVCWGETFITDGTISLKCMPTGGGAVTTLYTLVTHATPTINGIAIANGEVYWTSWDGFSSRILKRSLP